MNGNAFKAEATVGPGGKVELNQPLPPGTAVEVIVFVPVSVALIALDAFAAVLVSVRLILVFVLVRLYPEAVDVEKFNA